MIYVHSLNEKKTYNKQQQLTTTELQVSDFNQAHA